MKTTRRTPRLYVPLDARFFDDDRVIRAGERAAWLYLNILAEIKADSADGTITLRKIQRLHVDNYRPRLEKLLAVGLLIELDSPEQDEITYLIPSWSKWNLLEHERRAKSEAARAAAEIRWNTDAKRNANRNASRMQTAMQRKTSEEKKEPTPLADLVDNALQSILDASEDAP